MQSVRNGHGKNKPFGHQYYQIHRRQIQPANEAVERKGAIKHKKCFFKSPELENQYAMRRYACQEAKHHYAAVVAVNEKSIEESYDNRNGEKFGDHENHLHLLQQL